MTTTYESGANRDGRKGKVSYRCRNPLVELSFAKYMDKCTYLDDGTRREPNNWWKGMNKTDDLDSLLRHVEDLTALHAGYKVLKVKKEGVEMTHYFPIFKAVNELVFPDDIEAKEVNIEDTLNAIRFNCGLYLLDYLKGNEKK